MVPKNCNECEYVKTCTSTYFGGLGCKFDIKPQDESNEHTDSE